jgi:hypothetical protein
MLDHALEAQGNYFICIYTFYTIDTNIYIYIISNRMEGSNLEYLLPLQFTKRLIGMNLTSALQQ